MGNLRLDIGNSAATLDKASKKKAVELSKKFYAKVRRFAAKICCLSVDAHWLWTTSCCNVPALTPSAQPMPIYRYKCS